MTQGALTEYKNIMIYSCYSSVFFLIFTFFAYWMHMSRLPEICFGRWDGLGEDGDIVVNL